MQTTCVACSGRGRYDHNGSPRCGSCGGTGKTGTAEAQTFSTGELDILLDLMEDRMDMMYKAAATDSPRFRAIEALRQKLLDLRD